MRTSDRGEAAPGHGVDDPHALLVTHHHAPAVRHDIGHPDGTGPLATCGRIGVPDGDRRDAEVPGHEALAVGGEGHADEAAAAAGLLRGEGEEGQCPVPGDLRDAGGAVVTAGGQPVTDRAPVEAPDLTRVAGDREPVSAGVPVPDLRHRAASGRGEPPAVRAPGDVAAALLSQGEERVTRPGVRHHGRTPRGVGQPLPVRAERGGRGALDRDGGDGPPGPHVDDPHTPRPGCRHPPAVRAERRADDPDVSDRSSYAGFAHGQQRFAAAGMPDPQRAVVTRGGQQRPVRAEGDLVDVVPVAAERPERVSGVGVADVDDAGLLRPLGHEQAAVRAPVERATDVVDAHQHPRGGHREMEGLDSLRQRRLALRARDVESGQGEQHAALGVGIDVGHGGSGELAGRRHPSFLTRPAAAG